MNKAWVFSKVQERKAQILMPAVLLAPIFILVIYLLFEMAKVSTVKVRHQLALDNAAYSQLASASTYLNAMAMLNGPLPYRVMKSTSDALPPVKATDSSGQQDVTIFELFYKGGGVPTIGPDYDKGENKPPAAELNDWGLRYYSGELLDKDGGDRSGWEKENPSLPPSDKDVPVMSKALVDKHYVPAKDVGVPAIVNYIETYARLGSIYKSQDYVYQQVSKNAIMFREAYYLNVNDCKRADCARQSAAQIRQVLSLHTKPFELNRLKFWVSESGTSGYHHGAYSIPFKAEEILNGEKLFQFAYVDPSSRSRLKTLSRGVLLKQPFKLPRNHFNINLEQKYKPYVRNRVIMSCPRNSNNCVWPNPLPKYSITLDP